MVEFKQRRNRLISHFRFVTSTEFGAVQLLERFLKFTFLLNNRQFQLQQNNDKAGVFRIIFCRNSRKEACRTLKPLHLSDKQCRIVVLDKTRRILSILEKLWKIKLFAKTELMILELIWNKRRTFREVWKDNVYIKYRKNHLNVGNQLGIEQALVKKM